MKAERLDALLFPGSGGAAVAARPGYPTIVVPFALVPNISIPPFPESFDAKPGPFGVSFTGMACSEPRLIELGYAFEQATKRRGYCRDACWSDNDILYIRSGRKRQRRAERVEEIDTDRLSHS